MYWWILKYNHSRLSAWTYLLQTILKIHSMIHQQDKWNFVVNYSEVSDVWLGVAVFPPTIKLNIICQQLYCMKPLHSPGEERKTNFKYLQAPRRAEKNVAWMCCFCKRKRIYIVPKEYASILFDNQLRIIVSTECRCVGLSLFIWEYLLQSSSLKDFSIQYKV